MKYKEGLYAVYSKYDGIFVGTKSMYSNDAHKGNANSQTYEYVLLTEDNEMMDNYPRKDIPIINPSWDGKETDPDYHECERCFEYYLAEDMYYISDDFEEVSECKKCNKGATQ